MLGRAALLCFLAILVSFHHARAQERVSITAYAGFHVADDDQFVLVDTEFPQGIDQEIDDAPILGVRVGVPVRGPVRAELSYGRTSTEMVVRVSTIEEPVEGIPLTRETYVTHHLEIGVLWLPAPLRSGAALPILRVHEKGGGPIIPSRRRIKREVPDR